MIRSLGALVGSAAVLAVVAAVNLGYLYKTACPTGTHWSWTINDVVPYTRTANAPCVSHSAGRLLVSWVGISKLGGSRSVDAADSAFVKQTSGVLSDISTEFARERKEANTLKDFNGDRVQAALTVTTRSANALKALRSRMRATPVAHDHDLISLRTELTHWIGLQVQIDQLIADSVKAGTLSTTVKLLPKTKLARDIATSHDRLNTLAVTLQDRYPALHDWGFLQTLLAVIASVVGLTLSVGVAIHEWIYRHDHPYATGVSGVLVVLALGVAAACVAVLHIAVARVRGERRR